MPPLEPEPSPKLLLEDPGSPINLLSFYESKISIRCEGRPISIEMIASILKARLNGVAHQKSMHSVVGLKKPSLQALKDSPVSHFSLSICLGVPDRGEAVVNMEVLIELMEGSIV